MNDRQIWKLHRIAKNIKIIEIANELGISSAYISMHESGKANMNTKLLNKYKTYIEGHTNE